MLTWKHLEIAPIHQTWNLGPQHC